MSPMTDPNYLSMEGFIALLIIGLIANIIVWRKNK
jgi:hypothetical protein